MSRYMRIGWDGRSVPLTATSPKIAYLCVLVFLSFDKEQNRMLPQNNNCRCEMDPETMLACTHPGGPTGRHTEDVICAPLAARRTATHTSLKSIQITVSGSCCGRAIAVVRSVSAFIWQSSIQTCDEAHVHTTTQAVRNQSNSLTTLTWPASLTAGSICLLLSSAATWPGRVS